MDIVRSLCNVLSVLIGELIERWSASWYFPHRSRISQVVPKIALCQSVLLFFSTVRSSTSSLCTTFFQKHTVSSTLWFPRCLHYALCSKNDRRNSRVYTFVLFRDRIFLWIIFPVLHLSSIIFLPLVHRHGSCFFWARLIKRKYILFRTKNLVLDAIDLLDQNVHLFFLFFFFCNSDLEFEYE